MTTRPSLPLDHPLHTAELRSLRAKQLVATLKRQLRSFSSSLAKPGVFDAKETEPGFIEMRQVSKEPLYGLARASVTVGEAIYNLRAALDYTIFDVAWACNGMRPVEWTQFPIDDDPETFWLRPKGGTHSRGHVVRAYLRKVPAPIVEKVREYQPFAGCWWTGPLRDLSNPDKHRSPIGLAVTGAPEIRDVEPSGYIDSETGVEWMQAKADLMTVVSFEEFPQFPIVNYLAFVQREVHAFVLDVAPGFTITPRG